MAISTDYPHFDSSFPFVTTNLLTNVQRDTAKAILLGGAGLYGFDESDFLKADQAASESKFD